jgi:hypothetical protein
MIEYILAKFWYYKCTRVVKLPWTDYLWLWLVVERQINDDLFILRYDEYLVPTDRAKKLHLKIKLK